jgi:hypothetical protein
MTKNVKSFQLKKMFDQILHFFIIYPWAFMKDVPAKREAFSPQKGTTRTSKHKISHFFFVAHLMLIWIHNTGENRGTKSRHAR